MSHAEGGSFYSDWQIFPIASIVSLRLLVWVFTDYVAGAGGLGLHVSRVKSHVLLSCDVSRYKHVSINKSHNYAAQLVRII